MAIPYRGERYLYFTRLAALRFRIEYRLRMGAFWAFSWLYIYAERVVKHRNMYLTVVEDTSLIRNQLYLEVRPGKNVAADTYTVRGAYIFYLLRSNYYYLKGVDAMTSNQFATIRRVAGLTRQQFADKAGISPQLVNAIERGDKRITPRTAALVQSAFGLDADKLTQLSAAQKLFK